MTDGQYSVIVLLLVLFALEAVRNQTIYAWLKSSLAAISGAVSGK